MVAIYKREMRAYFTTPIGYVFSAIFLIVAGACFAYTTLFSMSTDVTPFFTYMLILFVILLPLLTMKLFSEERKQQTEQLLMTAPVSITSTVLAKFFAAATVFASCLTISCCSFFILYGYGEINTAMLLGNYLAALLVGLSFLAVGVFVSALTENQLTAAVGTIALLLVFLLIGLLNSFINVYAIRFILSSVSIFSRFQNFTQGIFDVSALVYYLSVCAVFLFLTIRVYDRRRWN